jgi:uncharacterized membrane protein YdjX (TVP38/TMEM64 family)
MTVPRSIPRVLLALLIAASAVWVAVNRHEINVAALNDWIDQLGSWSLIGYVAVYAVATVVLVPGSIFGLAGGCAVRTAPWQRFESVRCNARRHP